LGINTILPKQATITREFEEGSQKINCQERIDLTADELKIIILL
jgi:hypothetical protein